jgi:transposase
MCNPKITTENYNTQLTLLPDTEEKKKEKRQLAPTFKPYNNHQVQVIFDIESHIPENHVARVVDEMVEAVPDKQLFAHYTGGGRSPFHPKMMLKIILFGYSQKVYSCRGIEKLIRDNIPAMWLAAMQKPDFRTINEFRGERMKVLMDELFEAMIHQLMKEKYITMENYFLDGTKIEADANKYSFVWKKSTTKFEAKLKENIQKTLQHIHELTQLEAGMDQKETRQNDGNIVHNLEVVAEQLEEKVAELTEEIEKEQDTKIRKEMRQERSKWKKPLKLIRENFIPRLAQYEEQSESFGDRNSYSKTDKDATFMRMKEDHMKNGQLKPGYNVQMATENQFVLFYTIHQRPTDTRCFIPHLEKLAKSSLPMPKTVVADAGYGSEENYVYAVGDEKQPRFDFLIPYGTYLQEQTRKFKNDIKNAKNWIYQEQDDCLFAQMAGKLCLRNIKTKRINPVMSKASKFTNVKIVQVAH